MNDLSELLRKNIEAREIINAAHDIMETQSIGYSEEIELRDYTARIVVEHDSDIKKTVNISIIKHKDKNG